jgi:PAS domain S-box-containing protein
MNEAVKLTDPLKRQVLVVDDDTSVCETYRRSLTRAGYDVHSAFSYKEAISILTEKNLDAVVSDIFLGNMDGLDVLEQCHRLNPDTPVILVTGLPTVETASEAVRLKAYEYLSKPVRLEKLTSAVARAVELKSQRLARKHLEIQERNYKRDLEHLVAERTKRLIESNRRYQLLFENSKDAIFMASWDGNFLTLNQSALQLFGYKEDELIAVGNTSVLYADPEQHAVFQREIQERGFVKDFEVRFKQKNGAPIDCLLTAHLLERSNGKIEGYQGIIRDITAQKKTEKKSTPKMPFSPM